jgi:ABC-type sugar transport system permease subunit
MYDPHYGPITVLARLLGLMGEDQIISWLNDPKTVIPAIIFLGFPWISGTNVLIYMSGLMNVSTELIESSRLDGANIIQRIMKIDIPMLTGQIKFFLIFGIIGGLQDYGIQIILTNGGPGYTTYVPGYYMYLQAFNNGRMGYASTIGAVLFFAILLLTVVNYRFFKSDTD